MLKPLELPWRVRLWQFIRGLLFYNTVYWRRASDDLKPPTLSREERLSHQPERNMEIIRPREHPRAKIVAARGGQVSLPMADSPETSEPSPAVAPDAGVAAPEVVIRRRRYRRRHSKIRPDQFNGDPALNAKSSYFGWLFTRKKRR